MARSDDQNRTARERSREAILDAATALFAEHGVSGASIAAITQRAGVAQGLVSYHFGGKDHLVSAVVDRWFETLFGIPEAEGSADERLAGIIDGALLATGYALPVQRAVFSLQQQPKTHRCSRSPRSATASRRGSRRTGCVPCSQREAPPTRRSRRSCCAAPWRGSS